MTDPVRDRPSVPETYQMPDANGDMIEWDSVRKRAGGRPELLGGDHR